jgi:hypothetical protein
VGFTGGTGGLTAVQNILNWTYTVASGAARLQLRWLRVIESTVDTDQFHCAPDYRVGANIFGEIQGFRLVLTSPMSGSAVQRKPRTLPISDWWSRWGN